MLNRTPTTAAILGTILAGTAGATPDRLVTFDNGTGGWSGSQGVGGVGTFVDPDEGDPAPGLRTVFNDFGITFRNTTNPDFVLDLSNVGGFSFGIDTKVNDIAFFGSPVPRPWLLEFRDFDAGPNNDRFASVWYKFADISAATHGQWNRFFVRVMQDDVGDLPDGWRGAGAEDPVTFEPMLPEGITFADVLEGYDEIVVTTLEPGFFFGFTDFDVVVDDIRLDIGTDAVPCNDADLAEPFDIIDLADIQCFIFSFTTGLELADFAPPFGVLDLADIQAFINAFLNGCP